MILDIVTPRGQLVSSEVDEVVAPGVLGEFGVLPGHIPFISAIKPGVVRWKHGEGEGRAAVGPGFLEVGHGDRIVLLAGSAVTPDKIDAAAARKEAEEAQAALDKVEDADDPARAELGARRDWAQARVDAAGAPAAH